MADLIQLFSQPEVLAALATLIVMEVVLGIDNLLFISILTNRLPEAQRKPARQIGIGLALILRLGLLAAIGWIIGLKATALSAFGQEFSWKDLILIAGGLFLLWKATWEIHEQVDPDAGHGEIERAVAGFGAAIVQILLLDMVFSVDSILTAVGMTPHLPVMYVAVIVAVTVMLLAAEPVSAFIKANPTIVMLALGFLLMIGMLLIAEGFGVHVPKGYIYTAMAFSALVEGLNMMARKRRQRIGGSPD